MYAVENKVKKTTSAANTKTLQRALSVDEKAKSTSKYWLRYTGKKKDFEDGSDPVGKGVTGVSSYDANAIVEKVYDNGNSYVDDVAVDANERQYHQGHMLAKALGGSGSAWNVFRQDGGQNTTGKWPSFERQVESARNYGDQNANMSYDVELFGTGGTLKYNQVI